MSKPLTLTRNGSSLVVAVPKILLAKLGWRRGDVLVGSVRGDAYLVQRMSPPEPLMSVPDERHESSSR